MADYSGPDRRAHRWHLDKRLNVGHLLTTIALAGSMFAWGTKMDSRVTVLEAENRAQDNMLQITNSVLGARLDRIEAKLDRVIEGSARGGR